MQATQAQAIAAMNAAFTRCGVKNFTMVGGVYESPVLHSSRKAKELIEQAERSLGRQGLEANIQMVVARKEGHMAYQLVCAA